ncbi:MAG: FHA domain-containing protein [Armatimonadota bacterium]
MERSVAKMLCADLPRRYRALLSKFLLVLAAGACLACFAWAEPRSVQPGSAEKADVKASRAKGSQVFRLDLIFPHEGSFVVWARYKGEKGRYCAGPYTIKGTRASLSLPVKGDLELTVLDAQSKTAARAEVSAAPGGQGKLLLEPKDFSFAARVLVRVLSGDRAVSAALVTLQDSKGVQHQRILMPGQGGVVAFEGVALGRAVVRVQYNGDRTASQDVDIASSDAAARGRFVDVFVAGASSTESPAGERGGELGSARGERTVSERRGYGGSGLAGYAVALALVVLLVLVGMYLVRAGIVSPERLFAKYAAKPAEEQTAAEPEAPLAQVPPGVCEFCGTPKDPVTGACACSLPSTAASPASGAVVGTGPRFVVLSGPVSGQVFALSRDVVSLGREPGNDIVIQGDPTVSRRHAVVEMRGGQPFIIDQGSANGTFVNGARVTEAVLNPGDEVVLGRTRMRFEA